MKRGWFYILIALVLIACVQAVSAAVNYEVDSIEVTPSTGDLVPGDRVTVKCVISLTGAGDATFPSDHMLEAYTDLDDMKWTYTIKVNGVGQETTKGGRYLSLTGWVLSYPEETDIQVDYFLEGIAPESATSSKIAIFRLRQIDEDNDMVKNSEYLRERNLVNPEDVKTLIEVREQELSDLQSSIDARAADGVNTASAEEKYLAAKEAITKAKTSSYATAQTHLTTAGTLITEGNALLDQAWTAKVIEDAEYTIGEVDSHLTYFKEERNMASDARVLTISTQLDNANTLLTLAKDKQSTGDYSGARSQATNALDKAEEALNASISLRAEIGEGGLGIDVGGIFPYILIIAVLAIAGIVGYVFYKRYYRWDELG
ncbi:MAG: hypothetical protein RQ758_04655 [Methanomicrobiaceae archaeon]|nr:hypothetical protein [Methanomicrobiaceae archaeon]